MIRAAGGRTARAGRLARAGAIGWGMGFFAEICAGGRGVRFAPPPGFELQTDERDAWTGVEHGLGWQCAVHDVRLDLQPQHHALLVRDAEQQTRDLFVLVSARLPRDRPLRTDDPSWSPLVELTPRALSGGPGLTVIHRMTYQPGHEVIMGHLLAPVRAGLFELRVFGRAATTGMRESVLLMLAGRESPGEDPIAQMRRLGQAHYDDPAHDARFPDHPLTRVREGLAWALAHLEVVEPDAPAVDGEVELPGLGCAVVPPPRYRRLERGEGVAQFTRVSFAGTDGVQLLTLARMTQVLPRADAAAIARLAEELARASVPPGATGVAVEAAPDGPERARAAVRQDGEVPRHTLLRVLRDAGGDARVVALAAPRSTPEAELAADLDGVVASLRPLAPDGPRRRWWKPWSWSR